jgi:serine/threonine protein kinase
MLDMNRFVEHGELFDGHYKILRPLSTDGATADVWLAIDVNTIDTELSEEPEEKNDDTGILVAIKIYRPKNALDIEGEQRFRDEYKIVFECRHANLLQPTGFSIFAGTPYLVLPFCKSGSSEQLIGKELTEDEIWKFIMDVSSGLDRLHTNEPLIVHQDIKPANILIDNSHNYVITDFGISSKRDGVHGYYTDEGNSGTLAYMAPERFRDDAVPMAQSDIWGFGATLCEILTGKVPFGEDGGQGQGLAKDAMPALPGVSPSVQRLIHACLDPDPGKRPTARQIVEAARVRQYPVRSKILLWILIPVLLVAGAVAAFFYLKPEPVEPPVPLEDSFEQALMMMDSDEKDVFLEGYHRMDSLSKLDYIPAIYEMAFTLGWYSDDESLRRKEMLGIEYEIQDRDRFGISKSDKDNQQAVSWLQQIMDKQDSAYADVNAQAAYRLAGYYVNGEVLKKDVNAGREWMRLARGWAEVSGDTELLQKIDRFLSISN